MLGRKVVTFLVFASFCAASVPLPVATIDIRDKDHSQPFPCQKCPCGCKTAEQCWTNCCCFTPAERLAWAEKNGVTPPSYVQRPSSEEAALERISNRSQVGQETALTKSKCCEPRNACCQKQQGTCVSNPATMASGKLDCCAAQVSKPCGSCCQTAKPGKVDATGVNVSRKRKVVLSVFALKCQGKSFAFTLLPSTILACLQEMAMMELEFGPAHQAMLKDPPPVFLKPDTPPPKQLLS